MAELDHEQIIPDGAKLFEDINLKDPWNQGIRADAKQFQELYKSLLNKDTAFPAHLNLKFSMSECELDSRGALCFLKRVWIANWEPLQTKLIQKTHDSHVTGHPGRNNTLAILSRSFFWPGMSVMVRKF